MPSNENETAKKHFWIGYRKELDQTISNSCLRIKQLDYEFVSVQGLGLGMNCQQHELAWAMYHIDTLRGDEDFQVQTYRQSNHEGMLQAWFLCKLTNTTDAHGLEC